MVRWRMGAMVAVLLLVTSCACVGSGSRGSGGSGDREPVSEWIEVFAEQEWHDSQADEVSTFSGTLTHVPGDSQPSFVMRYNPYKLELSSGDGLRDVYCGSSDELLPFVGAPVEIQGRLVIMEVEGQVFNEIWPVRIRKL